MDTSLFILGNPIKTSLGDAQFLKVSQMNDISELRFIFDFDKDMLINYFSFIDKDFTKLLKQMFDGIDYIYMLKAFNESDFGVPLFNELHDSNKRFFELCYGDEDAFDKIDNQEEYEYQMKLLSSMNKIKTFQMSPNPKIRQMDAVKASLGGGKNGTVSIESMITSVSLFMGMETLVDMSVYQLYSMFDRIGQFDNYIVTRIGSFISSDIDVISWASDPQENGKEQKTITDKDLKQSNVQGVYKKEIIGKEDE